ncbi:uncharacterized protein LOC136039519 isoform X2 [Artemia franciscana]|uniref:CUB domain-containing protein n=2 Tax=Artemia franciscana TaxID=6661 RepID=A0AA88HVY4_ARTSF|nr:hypothetical protein QYM36_007093 [Artemia franciscana]
MVVRFFFQFLLLLAVKKLAVSVHWTHIHTDIENSIDLWTRSPTGCKCPFDEFSQECACCAKGGCNCGHDQPSRCTQCGLENRCLNLCNVTIDAQSLFESSGKTFGQIKSPIELHGQSVCWYKFRSSPGKRIELQIYRIVGMGHKNGTRCEGGGVSWYYDVDSRKEAFWEDSDTPLQLCGLNERYFPPVTLFGNANSGALLLRFDKLFDRSRFLAYFSFTNSTDAILGFQTKGGEITGSCSYEFFEDECKSEGSCSIASPGFPGLYPPNRNCYYHITASSPFTAIRLKFSSVSFSESLCLTDDVLISRGRTKSKLLTRLCGRNKTEFRFHGPHLLIEFRSGNTRPALEYNGFKGNIYFESILSSVTNLPNIEDNLYLKPERLPSAVCDYEFGNKGVTSGFFSSDTTAWRVWPAPCTIHFVADQNETVLVNLIKYKLSGPNCKSYIEVYDTSLDIRWPNTPIERFCSPIERKSFGSKGFIIPLIYKSRGSGMALRFKLDPAEGDHVLEGAFAFEEAGVTSSMVENIFYKENIQKLGNEGVLLPFSLSAVDWNVLSSIQHVANLKPNSSQKIVIEFNEVHFSNGISSCNTGCGRGGCYCRWIDSTNKSDYILVLDVVTNATLLCLCGDPGSFLPLRLVSNHGVRVVTKSVSHAWPDVNILYKLTWKLLPQEDNHGCRVKTLYPSSGFLQENRSMSDILLFPGYSYYYRYCSWQAQMEEGEQRITSISTSHAGPCSDWNATFSLIDSISDDSSTEVSGIERVLKIVCPDQPQNMFITPPMVRKIQIRLISYTMIPTDFRLQWQTTQYIIPTPGDRALLPHSTDSSSNIKGPGNNSFEHTVNAHCGKKVVPLLIVCIVLANYIPVP